MNTIKRKWEILWKKLEQGEGIDNDGEIFYQIGWSWMWPMGRIKADFASTEERTR